MDEDEFNDFQQAPPEKPVTNIEEDPVTSELPIQPQVTEEVVVSQLPENIMQPSYSVVTNLPSQPIGEMESAGWEGSNLPNLGKIESDHLAQVQPMEPDFSKRKSEGESNDKSTDYPNPPEVTEVSNELQSNISNVATLNSQSQEDFDFGTSPQKSIQQQAIFPSFTIEKKEVESYKESEDQNQNPKIEENLELKQEQVNNEEINFVQQEQVKQQILYEQQDTERQPQILNETPIEVPIIENQLQMEQKESIPVEVHSQIVQQTLKTETKEEKQEISPQPQIKQQEDEQEDQFGDFQETVQESQTKPVEQFVQQPQKPVEPQPDPVENKVQIYPKKLPLETNLTQRQKELQKFVDSLPDYSFLLVQAFNSL